MIDKKLLKGGAEVYVNRSEKWENHKNSTHSNMKFYIILILKNAYDLY